jgi:transposase
MIFGDNAEQKYFFYSGNTDMRKGFDSLCGIVTSQMHFNTLSRDVYIFINRRHTQIKLLQWEGDGFSVYYKRLEKGSYALPFIAADQSSVSIDLLQLQMMFEGVSMKRRYHCRRYQHNT